MAAEVDLLSHSWSFSEFPSHDQSQEEPVREALDHGSISFGRYETESLSWEKKSVFTHDRKQEELNKLTFPGSVAHKKAYFEQYYKKVRNLEGLRENNQPSIDETQTSTEIRTSNEIQTSSENETQTGNEIENSRKIENSDVIQTANDIENSDEMENSDETENPNELQISDEIQVSDDEIQIPNGSISNSNSTAVCAAELQSDKKDREESRNNKIITQQEPAVPTVPVQLVRREKKEKYEHGQKLARAFDDLSKDWVKLKKGMTPIRRNAGAESENRQKFESLRNGVSFAVKRSFGTIKDMINNSQKKVPSLDKNKNSNSQFEPIKESQKSSFRTSNLVHKTAKVGTKSRPGTASSCSKPSVLSKPSIGTKTIKRNEAKSKEKSVAYSSSVNNKRSVRSSWESLMRPTAASSARVSTTEVKRTSIGVRKPVSKVTRPLKRDSSSVPQKPRSFLRNKSRPNSDKTLRATERKKPTEKKVISSGTKRVVAKKTSDSNTRLRKVLSARTETALINKRTKLSASSSLHNNKKKQRQERPAWR